MSQLYQFQRCYFGHLALLLAREAYSFHHEMLVPNLCYLHQCVYGRSLYCLCLWNHWTRLRRLAISRARSLVLSNWMRYCQAIWKVQELHDCQVLTCYRSLHAVSNNRRTYLASANQFCSALYLCNLGCCIYAMLPNKINDISDEDEEEEGSTTSEPKDRGVWEMHNMKTPSIRSMPYTPRTQAFHTLDRQLPLRSQQQRFG